ncbi:hypothetical protein ACI65C_001213 [Semiaphis heraclei]
MHSINKNASPQDLNLPNTSKKRTSSVTLTPPHTSKNRFSPLLTLQDTGDTCNTTENDSTQQPQIKITTSSIENTSIQIQIGDKELRLSAVYKKPDTPLLTSDLDSLLNTSHYVVIAGDLNAKHESWNSRRQNTAGNTLAKFLDKRRDLTIAAPTSPTHYPDNSNHNADIMDVAILKTGKLRYSLENLTAELSSDHTPIILELQAQGTQTLPPKPFKYTDWIKFKLDTKNVIFDLKKMHTTEQVDQAITELTTKILLSDNEWVNFLSNIDSTSEGWSKIYKLNKNPCTKDLLHFHFRILKILYSLHYDAIAKSEIFADSMEKQFQTSDYTTQTDELVKNAIEEDFKLPYTKNLFFSPGEIQFTISKLPCQKAPGPDQLTHSAESEYTTFSVRSSKFIVQFKELQQFN